MYNFKDIEAEADKILTQNDIDTTISHDKKRKKTFSFLEGPPTANAPPALHHLEVRTYKDIINKFRYMRGYNVPRKAGWDCHGLPVEVQIEKKLKLNSKKDILSYGEARFIDECRKSVFSYIESWNTSTRKLGYLVDLKNPYATLTNEYIESVWWSLKELYKKKLLYEAHKVVPFCPRCETPLSSHEVAQGYKNIKEDSIIVKFKIKNSNEYFLVFTTTPWTLPSNVGIAINPDIDYDYIQDNESGKVYIIAKNLAEKHFDSPRVIKSVKGKKLLGLTYEPLFPYFATLDAFRIIKGDFVTETDGTGLVHMAPAFGEVDYDACKKEGLPFVQPVDETGKFTKDVPDYQGIFIKTADKKIIQDLEARGSLFKKIRYEHDYPFCWRCDTPLMYYAIKSWFIRVTAYKDRLLELNESINWTPKYIKEGRFGEWLRNVKDWALSRKKFWGTPLPIWRCPCGHEEIIGSVDELEKKASSKIPKNLDLHKPMIDTVTLVCEKCKKHMHRLHDVIDCWYDSGSASFAQFHYPFENKAEFEKRFPYDFISEAIDQTRGWFYTLHVLATILFDSVAYKNVICAGHIVDEKGEKMSKSKGNTLDPDMVLSSVGVDATRLQFCTMDIGSFKKFGIETVKKDIVPFLNVFWNTYQFYLQLNPSKKAEKHIEDAWIMSRLTSIVQTVTESLEQYQIEKALNPLIDFIINDFSKTYIKMIRERDDANVKNVVGEILEACAKMLAPFAPNISDVVYQAFGKESVHLSEWPSFEAKKIDADLEAAFSDVLKVIERGLAARDALKVGLRWPLGEAIITGPEAPKNALHEIIKQQLNVKKVSTRKGSELTIEFDTTMTPALEAEGFAREIARRIQAARKDAGLSKEDRIELVLSCSNDLKKKLEMQKEFILERTGSVLIAFSDGKNLENALEVRSEKVSFSFKKTRKH